MTSQDFSQEFDILYNNISSNQAPGLTEYEKSVFLTQAQEALILDLYKGIAGDSFETTEEVTRYLSSLVTTYVETKLTSVEFINSREIKITLPSDVWFITFQAGSVIVNDRSRDVIIVPVTQDSLYKTLENPFRGPNKNRVLALSEEEYITLYTKYDLTKYYMKYLKRPNPIVLEDSELPINEVDEFSVDLPESLHRQILLRAVQLAKAVWVS